MQQTIEIDLEHYHALLEESNFLAALESAGVDGWDGYSHAQDIFDAFNKED